jgi:hypothetical protein
LLDVLELVVHGSRRARTLSAGRTEINAFRAM